MFNLKSFVLNRRFLAKPKRVNSLWSYGLTKSLDLMINKAKSTRRVIFLLQNNCK